MRENPYMTEEQLFDLNNWLLSEEACNFTEDTFTCGGDLSFTSKWLSNNNIGNVAACLDWFRHGGGYCDCEIIWNVLAENRWPDRWDEDGQPIDFVVDGNK